MRLLAACSLGGAGHLQPLLPVLDAARRRGDDIVVVGPPALGSLVEATGHRFRPGGEPAEDEIAPIRERLPVLPADEASILGNRELFARLAADALLPAVRELCRDWRPDLVLREPCEYASAIVAVEEDLVAAQVAISLAEVEAGSLAAAAPALDQHRAGVTEAIRTMPYVTRLPESLDPSPFPTLRFREGSGGPPSPLPDWWDGSDAPLVYLTFGTVLGHMTMAADVFEAALAAVAGDDLRVLLTVGRFFDPAHLGPAPDNVHVERWVDQHDVLAAADLVVCHGGSGTAFGALAARLPLVTIPLFADQFENSRRIAERGAGLGVADPHDRVAVRAAIDEVLLTPSFAHAAGEVADEMAAAPAIDEVLADLSARARRAR